MPNTLYRQTSKLAQYNFKRGFTFSTFSLTGNMDMLGMTAQPTQGSNYEISTGAD